ncbi:MAG: hypothetical protein JWN56_3026, partial [Sphingobacteriales bacterium]|nr:hypothetical protein [Sphingobacteriales bacterium]
MKRLTNLRVGDFIVFPLLFRSFLFYFFSCIGKFLTACLFLTLLAGGNANAQSEIIQGTVSDATGPLPGVSVKVQGATTGVSTDV